MPHERQLVGISVVNYGGEKFFHSIFYGRFVNLLSSDDELNGSDCELSNIHGPEC